jgi:hypothetical protein
MHLDVCGKPVALRPCVRKKQPRLLNRGGEDKNDPGQEGDILVPERSLHVPKLQTPYSEEYPWHTLERSYDC